MLTAPRHLLVDRGNSPLSVPVQHWAPLRTFLNSVVWAEAALSPPPGVDGLCMVLRDGEEILPGGCSLWVHGRHQSGCLVSLTAPTNEGLGASPHPS